MANEIRMSPSEMETCAKAADTQRERMEDLISSMDHLLETLRNQWKGDAIEGYAERYQTIKSTAFKNTIDLLNEIARNLRASSAMIQETDQNIANQFRA